MIEILVNDKKFVTGIDIVKNLFDPFVLLYKILSRKRAVVTA
jgi:hypothetical protein